MSEKPTFVEPPYFIACANMGQQLTDENAHLRAQLAQREGEIEALRETVHGVRELVTLFDHTAVYDLKSDILAALSDNPESPALTDKEA